MLSGKETTQETEDLRWRSQLSKFQIPMEDWTDHPLCDSIFVTAQVPKYTLETCVCTALTPHFHFPKHASQCQCQGGRAGDKKKPRDIPGVDVDMKLGLKTNKPNKNP